jgi:hypothetical protein
MIRPLAVNPYKEILLLLCSQLLTMIRSYGHKTQSLIFVIVLPNFPIRTKFSFDLFLFNLLCLTPLSAIFHLYHGDQFSGGRSRYLYIKISDSTPLCLPLVGCIGNAI